MKSIHIRRPNKLIHSLLYGLSIFSFLFSSCSKSTEESTTQNTSPSNIDAIYTSATAEGSQETASNKDDLIANSTFPNTVKINWGSSITIQNPLEGQGVKISISNNDVIVTGTVAGVEYVLSGTTTDGSIKIYSDSKYKLTLNGLNITNNDGPAINLQSKKRCFLVLADGTINSLTDGTSYATNATEDQKATLFAEGQFIISGNGTLNVAGNYKHAVCSDQYIRIQSGIINISNAVSDGIHTNDAVIIDGGTINIKASSDGIEAEEGYIVVNNGTLNIDVGDDGITASYDGTDTSIVPYLVVNGGTFTIKASGEGIESKGVLTINKGDFNLQTADDAINSGGAMYLNGGNIYAYSTGNDAIDANSTITVTGGLIFAVGSRAPEAGFDCDAHTFKITGGLIVGLGGATSGPSNSVSTINSLVAGSGSAGSIIHIEDENATQAVTFKAPVAFSTMLVATSKLITSQKYTVYMGGSVMDGTDFHGIFQSGVYNKGTAGSSFTVSSRVTQIGGSISRG